MSRASEMVARRASTTTCFFSRSTDHDQSGGLAVAGGLGKFERVKMDSSMCFLQ